MGQVLKSLMPAYGGYSIARDEKVILIKGAIPGEVVEAEIEEKKKDYSLARVVKVLEPSEDRVSPRCGIFGICGGCQLQYISYEKQLKMKDEVLQDSLSRIGGLEITIGPSLSDLQWNYRRRAQFKVSRDAEVGFFRENSRSVVPVENCPLMDSGINLLLEKIRRETDVHNLSEIHLVSGDFPVALLLGKDYDRTLCAQYADTGLAGVALNDELIIGEGHTTFELRGLHYTVSPWTFFQSHWSLNQKVIDFIIDHLSPLEGLSILDLYAGAGNFSVPLAAHSAAVIGVEENSRAVEDGSRNCKLNRIRNCRIMRSSAEKYVLDKKYDIIILDPPRPGLTSVAAKKVLDNPSGRIVYISCNPATLSRDIKKLREKYDVTAVHQIDFFPHTFHIEAVAFLQLR